MWLQFRVWINCLARHVHDYGVAVIALWDSPHFWLLLGLAIVLIIVGALFVGEA